MSSSLRWKGSFKGKSVCLHNARALMLHCGFEFQLYDVLQVFVVVVVVVFLSCIWVHIWAKCISPFTTEGSKVVLPWCLADGWWCHEWDNKECMSEPLLYLTIQHLRIPRDEQDRFVDRKIHFYLCGNISSVLTWRYWSTAGPTPFSDKQQWDGAGRYTLCVLYRTRDEKWARC